MEEAEREVESMSGSVIVSLYILRMCVDEYVRG